MAEEDNLFTRLKGRVVVVGVGDLRHGDDGAGVLVAEALKELAIENVIDSGPSPELDTWRLREMCPDTVVFVDASDIKCDAGAVAILRPSDLRGIGFDTHRAPLRLTMEYLESELACKCFLVAIQPKNVELGAVMCDEVRSSALLVARILAMVVRTASGDKVRKR
ncbi:MAG: hydrogenase maturation protease [Armatimonadota bacterium]